MIPWIGKLSFFLLLSSCWVPTVVVGQDQFSMYFLEKEEGSKNPGERLLVITSSVEQEGGVTGCHLYDDEKSINKVLRSTPEDEIQTVSGEEIDDMLIKCDNSKGGRENDVTREPMMAGPKPTTPKEGYDGWNVIFPGTKWCGAGDIAKDYNDLGLHADTDKCCRAHDLCNGTLAPGETRNNLTNTSPFTKLSCQCDNDFYNCLDRVNSIISNKIGNVYFNILKRECYEEDYPLTKKCKKYRLFKITCKEYERDTKAKKVMQWKKAKVYKKLPFPGPITITLPWGF